jgi:DNA polymerase-1
MQISAATGRIGIKDPALQTIPRQDDLRNMIIPKPGCKLLSADLSQAELRVAAMVANDEKMLDAFAKGFDLHSYTAALMLLNIDPKDYDKKNKAHVEARQTSKTINFGILYGLEAKSLMEQINQARFEEYDKERLTNPDVVYKEMTLLEAQNAIDSWFKLYSGVYRWILQTKEFAKKHGYVETVFGRRRYLPYINSSNKFMALAAERQAVNTCVQSPANDITLMALSKINAYIKEHSMMSRIILVVHDEVIIEAAEEEIEELTPVLIDSMTKDVYKITIPLVADPSVMDKWSKG